MKDFLPQGERFARGIDLQSGDGPSQCHILFEDDAAVGAFKLRHGSGHIGCGIRRSCRGRGLGKAGVAMLLKIAAPLVDEDEV